MPMCASEFVYISSGGSKYELACKGGIVQSACLLRNSTPMVQHSCGTAKLICAVLYVPPLHGGRNCSFCRLIGAVLGKENLEEHGIVVRKNQS